MGRGLDFSYGWLKEEIAKRTQVKLDLNRVGPVASCKVAVVKESPTFGDFKTVQGQFGKNSVIPGTAVQAVATNSGPDLVVAGEAKNPVVVESAVERVTSSRAINDVVAGSRV